MQTSWFKRWENGRWEPAYLLKAVPKSNWANGHFLIRFQGLGIILPGSWIHLLGSWFHLLNPLFFFMKSGSHLQLSSFISLPPARKSGEASSLFLFPLVFVPLNPSCNVSDETVFLGSSANLQWTLLDFIPYDKGTPTDVSRIIISVS